MMPSRPRDMFGLRHPSDRPRRSLNSRKRRESPVGEFQVFNFGCLGRALHAAALRRLPGAVAPCSRGDSHSAGFGVGAQQRDFGRARTSQRISAPGAADTGGTPSGTKPRRWARTPASRSPPRARHLLIRAACSRGEYQRSAPPAPPPRRPRPRAASAPISQTCARRRRRPPAPPTLCWARAGSTPSSEASSSAVAGKSQRSTKLTDKRWSPRAARARATRRRPARSAAAASRPTRSRPTRPSAPRGPSGKTSLLKSRRPRRRTPTRPSLGEEGAGRIVRACR